MQSRGTLFELWLERRTRCLQLHISQQPSNDSSVLKSFLSLAVLHFSCIWHKIPSTVTEVYSCLQMSLLFALTGFPWASLILSVAGQIVAINIRIAERCTKSEKECIRPLAAPSKCFEWFWLYHLSGWKRQFSLLFLGCCLTRLPTGACQRWWFALTRRYLSNRNAVKSPVHFT